MSIDLLDYIHEYATGVTRDARPPSFTVDEFLEVLICSGGFELYDGRVAPRF
jgi:hypothetical protein